MTANQNIQGMESAFTRLFFSPWETTESSSSLTVKDDEITVADSQEVISAVEDIREYISGDNLRFTVEDVNDN